MTTYLSNSSQSKETIEAMMEAETWLNADEAVAMGFATTVVQGGTISASLNRPWIRNEPPKDKFKPDTEADTLWRVALNNRRLGLMK